MSGRRSSLDLNNANTDGEEEEGEPFCRGERLAEEDDGKGGGGEDLHLVADLERRGIEVRNGDKLEIILDDI